MGSSPRNAPGPCHRSTEFVVSGLRRFPGSARELAEGGNADYTMIHFRSGSCDVCVKQAQQLADLAQWAPAIHVVEVDIDAKSSFAAELSIEAVPTLVFFVAGTPVRRFRGLTGARHLLEELTTLTGISPNLLTEVPHL